MIGKIAASPNRRSSRGQAMVEFALVAPVFFVLLFAVIEAGRFVLYYQTLANATREGARYAIVHGANSARLGLCPSGPMATGSPYPPCDLDGTRVVNRVADAAFGLMGPAGKGITCGNRLCVDNTAITMWPNKNGYGERVVVHASYNYTTLIPIPLPPITISAESTLVINN
jgi:hypothetical protein